MLSAIPVVADAIVPGGGVKWTGVHIGGNTGQYMA